MRSAVVLFLVTAAGETAALTVTVKDARDGAAAREVAVRMRPGMYSVCGNTGCVSGYVPRLGVLSLALE